MAAHIQAEGLPTPVFIGKMTAMREIKSQTSLARPKFHRATLDDKLMPPGLAKPEFQRRGGALMTVAFCRDAIGWVGNITC